jgi:hypothetical protein
LPILADGEGIQIRGLPDEKCALKSSKRMVWPDAD